MRSKWLKFSMMIMAVVLCSSVAIAASPGTIKGQVLDSEGAVIKGAHLLFHPDASGQAKPAIRSDVMRESDTAGRFEVQLEPGFYDVCVMATAFTPECKKVLIVDGNAIQHDARLKADPLVMQHLGDKF
jgi:hypothetical protein